MSFTGTLYRSAYFGIDQTFTDSMFYMTPSSKRWYWQGTYESTVVNTDFERTLYQSGTLSERVANTTTYY